MHTRTSTALVAATVAAFAIGSVAAPAGADAARITKNKVRNIAAKVVDEKAPSLSVAKAATADTATKAISATTADTATKAISATTAAKAADSDLLGGKPGSAYGTSMLDVASPALYTDFARRLDFTITGLPDGQPYLLSYSLAFDQDKGALTTCSVGLSNPVAIGAAGGNTAGTLGVLAASVVVARSGNRDPQVTCIAAGTGHQIRIADAKATSRASSISLLRIDNIGTANLTSTTQP